MKVASADTTERNTHNGITRVLSFGLRLINKLELAVGYVDVGEHNDDNRLRLPFCKTLAISEQKDLWLFMKS